MTVDETVKWFNDQVEYNKYISNSKSGFLCGVTSDIDKLRSEGIRVIVCFTKCNTQKTADNLLTRLQEDGFTIENQTESPEDVYVYMCKKQAL